MSDSPFDVLCGARRPERADKHRLVDVSRRIEARALTLPATARMWVGLQSAAFFTERTEWVYRTIASVGVTVDVHAPGLEPHEDLPPTLRLHDVARADWTILLLHRRAAWGLAARDRSHRHEPDDRRSFEWVVTRDWASVAAAAEAFVAREPELLSSARGPSPV